MQAKRASPDIVPGGGDRYSALLDLSVALAEKAAQFGEEQLSKSEAAVRLVTWLDCQVCNGGWEQWLYNTTVVGISETIEACELVGCGDLAALARQAMIICGIAPSAASDVEKASLLDQLDERTRNELSQVDEQYWTSAEEMISPCMDFVLKHRDEFGL